MSDKALIGAVVLVTVGYIPFLFGAAYFSPPGPNPDGTCMVNETTIKHTEIPAAHNHYSPREHIYHVGDTTYDMFATFDGLEQKPGGEWVAHFSNERRGAQNSFVVPQCR